MEATGSARNARQGFTQQHLVRGCALLATPGHTVEQDHPFVGNALWAPNSKQRDVCPAMLGSTKTWRVQTFAKTAHMTQGVPLVPTDVNSVPLVLPQEGRQVKQSVITVPLVTGGTVL